MCTLILAWQVFEDAPVLVAANRDEATDRRASPPRRWEGFGVPFLAPRDEEAGGTWIGHNAAGLVAGLANRWTDRDLVGTRSRGLLVADVLGSADVDAAVSLVTEAVQSTDYEGFSLLLADARTAVLLEWDGQLQVTPLSPGVHVVMNAGHDDEFRTLDERGDAAKRQAEAAHEVRRRLGPSTADSAADWLDRAAVILGDHEVGICIHGDGYGTRSAALIGVPAAGDPSFRFADGQPCRTPFERVEGQS